MRSSFISQVGQVCELARLVVHRHKLGSGAGMPASDHVGVFQVNTAGTTGVIYLLLLTLEVYTLRCIISQVEVWRGGRSISGDSLRVSFRAAALTSHKNNFP